MEEITSIPGSTQPAHATAQDRRRLRMLWIGLVTYLLIQVNAIRIVATDVHLFRRVPLSAVILASLMNFAVMTTLIVALRRVYKRLAKSKGF